MTLPTLALAASLLAAPGLAPAPLATSSTLVAPQKTPKGVHRDTYYGFEFKEPKKWLNVPMKTDEQWLAAKYVSDKSYTFHDKEKGWTFDHAPEIQVIAFPLEVMKKGGVDEEEEEVDGETVKILRITSPYRDYDDFLTRTFKGGGFYLSKKTEDEIDGTKVTKLIYTVDKLTKSGPQTIETWIYHSGDVDYAVQLVGLTKHWKKIQRAAKPVRQSFKLIEREGALNHSGATSDSMVFRRLDLADSDPKERRSKAQASEKVIHERAIAKLPEDGWIHKKTKRVMMISSADKRLYSRVEKHTNNMFDWLDENFGYLGDDAYMRIPVVRVCQSEEEAAAFTAGVDSGGYGGFWSVSDELLTWNDNGGWTGYAIDRLNDQIFRYWMLEKNYELSTALPNWIDHGLGELVTNSRMDSRKIDWRNDSWNIERFRTAVREGKATPPKDIFLRTSEGFMESMKDGDPFAESAMLIQYLASPDVKRARIAEGVLEAYLKNMIAVVDEVAKESDAAIEAARKSATGEDGDKKYGEARRAIFKKREEDILKLTFDRTFGEWDDDDWEDLTESFFEMY